MGLLNSLLGGDEWRGKPPEEKAADISRHKATRAALEAASELERKAGIREETPTYTLHNDAVIDSEQHVPWWRR